MLKLEWGDEAHQYVYTRFPAEWTWQEFDANRLQYEEMLNSVSHRVDFVADVTDTAFVPGNMLSNIVRVFNMRLENEGFVLVVGAKQFIRVTYNMFASVLPSFKEQIIFVDSMEEALAIVARNRELDSVNH